MQSIIALDFSHYGRVAGVDEVGRGPLVGNVVAAAVILNPEKKIIGLADSKKLTEKKREALYEEIMENALAWAVASASPEEIDQINILHATMLAMQRAVAALQVLPDYVVIDGNRCPELPYPSEAIVKGDSKVEAISAASILAKVVRDREMYVLHEQHPEYGFNKHKGYPTAMHMAALKQHGPLPQYRKSFRPVAQLLDASSS
ncbi:ribonuclease HII [Neptunomonas antarctica]|uniref:Ribonuclease HII n=1 Tax=Neptunomonas antarctica TaxID=619304 RepID=A0A1N7J9F3_9GAMM|nr:ribonuclease HII [Neptunomonas antarctica]SIS45891.1 RNase HII [Neptunomonas antarctica]